jgi:excisionase family DNA binding protein
MRAWLKKQLTIVEEYGEFDEEYAEHHGDDLREIVAEAGRRAAAAGLPACLRACSIRPGPISVSFARRVLAECLAAIEPRMKQETKRLLTVAEAAEQYNVSKRTLYRMIESEQLPVSRARGAIRIKPADLEACLKQEDSLFG